MRKPILTALFLLTTLLSLAQKGRIEGRVYNQKNNKPLEFATIQIQGTQIGSNSDLDGKFIFTGVGLGLLIGVTLVMAGVYRGMVDDGKALLDNSGADLWVVQKDTLGPYAESSSIQDDSA